MEDREYFCMDQAAQLMPDLTTYIMFQIQSKQLDVHPKNYRIKNLFTNLKALLYKSVESSNMEREIKEIFQTHLAKLAVNISYGNYNYSLVKYDQLEITNHTYEQNVLKLVTQFRRTVYSLVGTNVTAASL